ncbi:signal recognition particle-docking protein FtsY [Oleidesulfovibrio sp.]|uniref:signal recognition particle-docking protein FtsY n=1 Tax=Oleidesulfovibrio sp. TaxID=2909707 RepID=UPI003A8ABFF0
MGFFSKLKRFWGGAEEPEVNKQAQDEQTAESGAEQADDTTKDADDTKADATGDSDSDAGDSGVTPQDHKEEPAQAESQPDGASVATDADEGETEPESVVAEEPAEHPAGQPAGQPHRVAEVVQAPSPVAAAPVAQAEAAAADVPAWQTELTLALRGAEPRLSVWLGHVLQGIESAGDELWERLEFFFKALGAPADEARAFVDNFRKWLDDMEYEYVEDFRSELQYRLALALELEDEEDERNRLFLKLSEGLSKTKEQITRRIDGLLTTHSEINEAFWEELEEILIMADVGYEPAMKLVGRLRERVRIAGTNDPAKFKELMREELEEIFKTPRRIAAVNPPEVVLMVGVNGVGKTTTIAKLAYRARLQGKKVLIAAGDTFRAAAIEQLKVWADRVGAGFHAKGANSDPAAVAFEAMDIAVRDGYDILFVDTAGRIHTKVNLMEELQKIRNVLGKKHPGAPHRSILVIDATTGQNALSQTKLFNESCKLDEIVLTKLDGTAKGGIVVAVAMQFGIPITFVGLGEGMEDMRPFDGKDFAQALLGSD